MPLYYIPKSQFKIVKAEEIYVFIDATSEPDVKAVLALAWLTGSRIQELLNLAKKDFLLDDVAKDGSVIIRALKFGKIGYPSFSYSDSFVTEILLPYLARLGRGEDRLFSHSKRFYQGRLFLLNTKLYPADRTKWITFHYLRHSRLTHLAQVLKAFPEELKSWTGHRSSAFEEYYAPRRVDRFKGKLGQA
jgi:integrase